MTDAQELQVEELVLYVFLADAAADDVWNDGDAESALDGGSYGYSPRAPTYSLALELSVRQLVIHIFGVVSSDVNEQRIAFHQFLYRSIERFCAVAFQWRQYLEGDVFVSCTITF